MKSSNHGKADLNSLNKIAENLINLQEPILEKYKSTLKNNIQAEDPSLFVIKLFNEYLSEKNLNNPSLFFTQVLQIFSKENIKVDLLKLSDKEINEGISFEEKFLRSFPKNLEEIKPLLQELKNHNFEFSKELSFADNATGYLFFRKVTDKLGFIELFKKEKIIETIDSFYTGELVKYVGQEKSLDAAERTIKIFKESNVALPDILFCGNAFSPKLASKIIEAYETEIKGLSFDQLSPLFYSILKTYENSEVIKLLMSKEEMQNNNALDNFLLNCFNSKVSDVLLSLAERSVDNFDLILQILKNNDKIGFNIEQKLYDSLVDPISKALKQESFPYGSDKVSKITKQLQELRAIFSSNKDFKITPLEKIAGELINLASQKSMPYISFISYVNKDISILANDIKSNGHDLFVIELFSSYIVTNKNDPSLQFVTQVLQIFSKENIKVDLFKSHDNKTETAFMQNFLNIFPKSFNEIKPLLQELKNHDFDFSKTLNNSTIAKMFVNSMQAPACKLELATFFIEENIKMKLESLDIAPFILYHSKLTPEENEITGEKITKLGKLTSIKDLDTVEARINQLGKSITSTKDLDIIADRIISIIKHNEISLEQIIPYIVLDIKTTSNPSLSLKLANKLIGAYKAKEIANIDFNNMKELFFGALLHNNPDEIVKLLVTKETKKPLDIIMLHCFNLLGYNEVLLSLAAAKNAKYFELISKMLESKQRIEFKFDVNQRNKDGYSLNDLMIQEFTNDSRIDSQERILKIIMQLKFGVYYYIGDKKLNDFYTDIIESLTNEKIIKLLSKENINDPYTTILLRAFNNPFDDKGNNLLLFLIQKDSKYISLIRKVIENSEQIAIAGTQFNINQKNLAGERLVDFAQALLNGQHSDVTMVEILKLIETLRNNGSVESKQAIGNKIEKICLVPDEDPDTEYNKKVAPMILAKLYSLYSLTEQQINQEINDFLKLDFKGYNNKGWASAPEEGFTIPQIINKLAAMTNVYDRLPGGWNFKKVIASIIKAVDKDEKLQKELLYCLSDLAMCELGKLINLLYVIQDKLFQTNNINYESTFIDKFAPVFKSVLDEINQSNNNKLLINWFSDITIKIAPEDWSPETRKVQGIFNKNLAKFVNNNDPIDSAHYNGFLTQILPKFAESILLKQKNINEVLQEYQHFLVKGFERNMEELFGQFIKMEQKDMVAIMKNALLNPKFLYGDFEAIKPGMIEYYYKEILKIDKPKAEIFLKLLKDCYLNEKSEELIKGLLSHSNEMVEDIVGLAGEGFNQGDIH